MSGILAIDPGKEGGIAYSRHGETIAIPMPLAGKVIDFVTIASLVADIEPDWMVLEKQGARPGQGVVSMFTIGQGYGALIGIAAGLKIPLEIVTPQRWKKEVLDGTAKDKDAAIAYCRRVFPTVNLVPRGCRKPSDGMADALCIFEYGRRKLRKEAAA
jgi:crossover junction endodeoxyribonuclease RuvC